MKEESEDSDEKDQRKKNVNDVTTFSVQFAVEEIKENITISSNAALKLSKKNIKSSNYISFTRKYSRSNKILSILYKTRF